jgi:hypothetical protein
LARTETSAKNKKKKEFFLDVQILSLKEKLSVLVFVFVFLILSLPFCLRFLILFSQKKEKPVSAGLRSSLLLCLHAENLRGRTIDFI